MENQARFMVAIKKKDPFGESGAFLVAFFLKI
jgi:hypothetical protein